MDATIYVNQEENGHDSRYDRYNLCMLPCEVGYKLNASIRFLDDTIKTSTKTTTKEKNASRHLVSNVYDISVSCIRDLYDMDLLKLIFYYSLNPFWMDFAS